MQGVFTVRAGKETKMTEIQLFASVSCYCHFGTSEREKQLVGLVCGIV